MSKKCSSCGHENRDVAIYCGNCGARLIAPNLGNSLRGESSSSSNNASKVTQVNNTNNSDPVSLCCGVLIILFIIMIIMSMG